VPADAGTPFDRPRALLEPLGETQHRAITVNVGSEPAAVEHGLVAGHHLDRRRAFVRIHPDHHSWSHSSSSSDWD
jgi:hypothetical protein